MFTYSGVCIFRSCICFSTVFDKSLGIAGFYSFSLSVGAHWRTDIKLYTLLNSTKLNILEFYISFLLLSYFKLFWNGRGKKCLKNQSLSLFHFSSHLPNFYDVTWLVFETLCPSPWNVPAALQLNFKAHHSRASSSNHAA